MDEMTIIQHRDLGDENPILEHTCIKDDGGTPSRECKACEAEKREAAAKAFNAARTGMKL